MQKPTERLKKKVEKENLWYFILSSLRKTDKYGKELRNIIKKKFGFLIGTVTAYKVLYLLEMGGYVRSYKDGKIVLYSITKKGLKELNLGKKMLKRWSGVK